MSYLDALDERIETERHMRDNGCSWTCTRPATWALGRGLFACPIHFRRWIGLSLEDRRTTRNTLTPDHGLSGECQTKLAI